jgi:hypothetical protein
MTTLYATQPDDPYEGSSFSGPVPAMPEIVILSGNCTINDELAEGILGGDGPLYVIENERGASVIMQLRVIALLAKSQLL